MQLGLEVLRERLKTLKGLFQFKAALWLYVLSRSVNNCEVLNIMYY